MHGSEGGGTELNRSFLPLSLVSWLFESLPESRKVIEPRNPGFEKETDREHGEGIIDLVRSPMQGAPRISSEHREGAPGKRTHACQDNPEAGTDADEAPFRLSTPCQVPDHRRGG